ncbi:damage-inducible protein DinB [Rhodobacteraceae bacterium NNCM2]|nr:damage-inducible protein DinB [Coraliihabitans acroporae]
MKAHFETMAAYNTWANRRLYAASAGLSEADYRSDQGAFFKSVEGTLNHIMVADLLWLARFRQQKAPPFGLADILHDNLDDLTAARRVLDADIVRFVDETPAEAFDAEFTYRALTAPGEQRQRLDQAVAHFFNHQTHHRGQVHTLLTRLTGDGPALDLLYYLREQK